MYQQMVCVKEFWYIVSGLDIEPEQLAIQEGQSYRNKTGSRLQNTTNIYTFSPI